MSCTKIGKTDIGANHRTVAVIACPTSRGRSRFAKSTVPLLLCVSAWRVDTGSQPSQPCPMARCMKERVESLVSAHPVRGGIDRNDVARGVVGAVHRLAVRVRNWRGGTPSSRQQSRRILSTSSGTGSGHLDRVLQRVAVPEGRAAKVASGWGTAETVWREVEG